MASTVTSTVPSPAAAPVEGSGFRTQAAAWVASLPAVTEGINAVAEEINVVAEEVGAVNTALGALDQAAILAAADTATTARDEAVAAAASVNLPTVTSSNAGDILRVDGSGALVAETPGVAGSLATLGEDGLVKPEQLPASSGGGLSFTRLTGSATLAANVIHRCYLTADATFTLPASPSDGDYLEVWDCGRTFDTHAVVVSGSVRGDAEGMTLDMAGSRTAFVYDAATTTWQDSSVLGG